MEPLAEARSNGALGRRALSGVPTVVGATTSEIGTTVVGAATPRRIGAIAEDSRAQIRADILATATAIPIGTMETRGGRTILVAMDITIRWTALGRRGMLVGVSEFRTTRQHPASGGRREESTS